MQAIKIRNERADEFEGEFEAFGISFRREDGDFRTTFTFEATEEQIAWIERSEKNFQ